MLNEKIKTANNAAESSFADSITKSLDVQQIFENLPVEIQELRCHFPLKLDIETVDGKLKKKFVFDGNGWNKPENQKTLAEIGNKTAGTVVSDYLFFDFDHVLKDGEFINEEVEDFVSNLQLTFPRIYIERSVTKTGLHCFLKPTDGKFEKITNSEKSILYFDKSQNAKLEIYYQNKSKCCFCTGDKYDDGNLIPRGELVDNYLTELLQEIKKQHSIPAENQLIKPSNCDNDIYNTNLKNNYSTDFEFEQARKQAIFDCISVVSLSDEEWFEFISSAKHAGFSYSEVDLKNREDPKRYDAEENLKRWNSANDPSFGIQNLYNLAVRCGNFNEKDFRREWHLDNKISRQLKFSQNFKSSKDRIKRDNCILSAPNDSVKERADIFMSTDTTVTKATLLSTVEAAKILGVSTSTLKNWRKRKLFGVPFFTADEIHGGTWYYYKERIEQLKEVYQPGILQSMYKLARNFSDNFQIGDSSNRKENSRINFEFGWLTTEEVAEICNVSIDTVEYWRKQKIFTEDMLTHDGIYLYTEESVEDFQMQRKKKLESDLNNNQEEEDVEKILDWQKHNGEISPEVLKYIKDAKIYLENLKIDDITAGIILSSKTKYAVASCLFYDFYSEVATNFVTRMKSAIQTAKEKVKSATAEKTVADEIKSLSSIRPSDFDKSVNVIVTETKNKHKNFLLRLNAEKANERREQYEQAPLTTRTNCHDCPVDLVLPYQTSFEKARGIFANDDKGRPKCISRTPLVPTRQFVNPSEGTHHYEIAINTHGNEWQKVIYDAESLFNAKNVMNLVNDGARFSSKTAADISEWFATILSIPENQELIQRVDIYNQPGWTDETCTEFIYPQNEEKYLVRTKNFDYEKAFAKRGEKSEWLKMFDMVLNKSAVTRLTLGAAFSAPLVNVLNIRNLQLHLSCPSGNGKTALVKFATSAYGNPEKFKFKFNGTSNSFETQATLFNDLPSWLEELQSANKKQRESIDQVIYDYESGIGRGRNTKNNFLQKQKYFRGVRISTGEQNLTNQFSGEGAISRILEITRADIFDNDFAIEVHQFCAENFGHFGQDWINFIVANKSDIRKHFNDIEKNFRSSGLMSNHITTLAVSYTALYFFCKMLDDVDTEKIESILISDFYNFVGSGELPTKDRATNVSRAIQTVAETVASHPKFFKAEKYDSNEDNFKLGNSEEGSAAYDYGFILKNGDVCFYPSVLREILKDYPSVDTLIRNFAERGYLDCGNDEKRQYQKASKYQGKAIWGYRFKKSALEN